jgi:hypothetical protein
MNKLISFASTTILVILLLHACQKKPGEVEKEIRYGVYLKNQLSVPVYIQNGYRYVQSDKDTIFISEKQQVAPGSIIKYNSYPGNLTGTTRPRTSYVSPANTIWLTINNKMKQDYYCPYLYYSKAKIECEKDPVNFFNSTEKWTETRHPDKDSVSTVYTIDVKDSLEAQ